MSVINIILPDKTIYFLLLNLLPINRCVSKNHREPLQATGSFVLKWSLFLKYRNSILPWSKFVKQIVYSFLIINLGKKLVTSKEATH